MRFEPEETPEAPERPEARAPAAPAATPPNWFDEDGFWAAVRPVMFSSSRFERAGPEALQLLALLGIDAEAHLLDLACGPGRHAIELAQLGHRVTALDRTAAYLDEGLTRSLELGVSQRIEWVPADMRSLDRDGAFDGAFCMFSSFGFFDDPRDDLDVLARVRRSLRPGGRFVLDVLGKELLAQRFEDRSWARGDDGSIWVFERSLVGPWRALEARWIRVGPEERAGLESYVVRQRLYSAVELEAAFRAAEYTDVRCLGGLDGCPYDQDASRLVVVGSVP